jgi:plastocyanin
MHTERHPVVFGTGVRTRAITEVCARVSDTNDADPGQRHAEFTVRHSRWVATAMTAAAIAAGWISVSANGPTTGRIEGTVRLVAPDERPIVSGAYPTRRVNKTAVQSSEISNVIVFLRDVQPSTRPGRSSQGVATTLAPSRIEMVQQDEAFVPRVVAIPRGSTVDFPNADPFFHNVFSLSRSATFDLGRFPRGDRRSRQFNQAGLIKVYCHLHSHMTASIMVFDHPHFTRPAANGTFILDDVPTGEHRVSAWHERIGESAKPIVIEPGRTVRVEFSLPVEGTE